MPLSASGAFGSHKAETEKRRPRRRLGLKQKTFFVLAIQRVTRHTLNLNLLRASLTHLQPREYRRIPSGVFELHIVASVFNFGDHKCATQLLLPITM